MSRKPAHQQFDTLKAIQDASFELFGRFGYDGVSIGAIAKAAAISKGALYWHYPGKEALYLACLKRLHGIFDEHILDPMRAHSDPVLGVLALFTGIENLLRDARVEKGIAGYWLVPSESGTEMFAEEQRQFTRNMQATLRSTFQRGVDQQRFDFHGDMDDMSRAVMVLVEAVVLPLRYMTAEEIKPMVDVLARTLLRAYMMPSAMPPGAGAANRS